MCFLMKVQMVYVNGLEYEVNGDGSTNLDNFTTDLGRDGVTDSWRGLIYGQDIFTSSAVEHLPYGMTTQDLADAQQKFTDYARLRIAGIGHLDYSREHSQAFEDMPMREIALELRDELADAVNYLTFLDIKLSRWLKLTEDIG